MGSTLVGAATGFLQTQSLVPDSTIGLRFWQANIFSLDQISLHPNFKLTLGLRYELNTVPGEINRRVESTFTSSEAQKFIAEEKRLFGVSGLESFLAGRHRIFQHDFNNVSPHLAFAWDPFGDSKTAVRAGYGIYFDQIPGAVISQSRSVFPRFLTINLAGVQQGAEIRRRQLRRAPPLRVEFCLGFAGLFEIQTAGWMAPRGYYYAANRAAVYGDFEC